MTRARVEVLRAHGRAGPGAGCDRSSGASPALAGRDAELAEAAEARSRRPGSGLAERGVTGSRRPPATPRPSSQRRPRRTQTGGAGRSRPPSRSGTAPPHGPRRSGRALQELQGSGGPRCSGATRAWSGPSSSWSRSTPATSRPSRRRSGRRWPRWSSRDAGAAKNALGRLRSHGTTRRGAPGAARRAGGWRRPDGAARRRRAAAAPRADPPGVGGALDDGARRGARPRRSWSTAWERAIDLALDRPELVVVTPEGDRFARSGWRARSSGRAGHRGRRSRTPRHAALAAASRPRRRSARAGAGPGRARRGPGGGARGDPGSSTGTWPRRRLPTPSGAGSTTTGPRLAAELEDVRRTHQEVARSAERRGPWPRRIRGLAARCSRPRFASARGTTRGAMAGRRALEARRAGAGRGRASRWSSPWPGWASAAGSWASARSRSSGDCPATPRSGRRPRPRRQRLEADVRAVGRAGRGRRRGPRRGSTRSSGRSRRRLPPPDRAGPRRRRAPRDAPARPRRVPRRGSPRSATRSRRARPRGGARSRSAPSRSPRWSASSSARARRGSSARRARSCQPASTRRRARRGARRTKLARLGPINPLALEELSALEERHRDLEAQTDDVRSARRELQEVVRDRSTTRSCETFARPRSPT